jgi:ankyrin repeat protein
MDSPYDNRDTELMLVAERGDALSLETLLQHNAEEQVTAVNADGENALIYAAMRGHAPCIKVLMQHYPELQVYEQCYYGWTALMRAAMEGHPSCIEVLLQYDPEEQIQIADEESGEFALILAVRYGQDRKSVV